MKTKITVLALGLSLSALSLLQAQIRSDFVLVQEGEKPHIVMDSRGRLHAVWTAEGIHYGFFDSLTYQLEKTHTITEGPWNDDPRLIVRDSLAIVFQVLVSPGFYSYIVGVSFRLDTGDVIGTFDNFVGDNANGKPAVTSLNDSTIMAVWTGDGPQTPRPASGTYGQVLTTSLDTISGLQLITDDVPDQSLHFFSRLASNHKSENAVVVWAAQSPDVGYNVFGRLLSKNGTPRDSTFIIGRDISFSRTWNSSVVMAADGSFAVAWSASIDDTVWNVYLRRFSQAGTPFAPVERVNEKVAVGFSDVDIAMDSDGRFVVAWVGLENNVFKIMAQRFASDGSRMGSNYFVSVKRDTSAQFEPSVILRDGMIYTAWTSCEEKRRRPCPVSVWTNILNLDNPALGVESPAGKVPQSFQLFPNYPNPFNPTTTIKYEIQSRGLVRLEIYNLLGEKLRTLVEEEQYPGSYRVVWNGKDNQNREVASGIYIYRLSLAGRKESKKMVLLQ